MLRRGWIHVSFDQGTVLHRREQRDQDQDLQATLQHAVMTYDLLRGRRIYVNGVWTDDDDEFQPARLWTWDPNHTFLLGNETSMSGGGSSEGDMVTTTKVGEIDFEILGCEDAMAVVRLDGSDPVMYTARQLTRSFPCVDAQ